MACTRNPAPTTVRVVDDRHGGFFGKLRGCGSWRGRLLLCSHSQLVGVKGTSLDVAPVCKTLEDTFLHFVQYHTVRICESCGDKNLIRSLGAQSSQLCVAISTWASVGLHWNVESLFKLYKTPSPLTEHKGFSGLSYYPQTNQATTMEATGTTTTRTAPSSPRSPRTESPVPHQSMTTASQSSQQASGGGGGGGDRSPDSVYKFAVPGFEQPGNSKVVPTDPAVHLSNNQPMSSSLAYSEDTDRDGFGEGDSDTYLALQSLDGDNDGFSVQTGQYANRRASSHGASHGTSHANNNDATQAIHEMHLALLYLLSTPEEFQAALPPTSGDALAAWNAECEAESTASASVYTAENRNNNDHPATTQRPSSVPHPPPPHSPAAPYVSGAANSNDTNHFHPTTPTATTPLPFAVFADDAEVVLPQAHTVSQLFGVEVLEGIELEAASGVPSISQLFLRWLGT